MSDAFAEAHRLLATCRIQIDEFRRWSLPEGAFYLLEKKHVHSSGPAAEVPFRQASQRLASELKNIEGMLNEYWNPAEQDLRAKAEPALFARLRGISYDPAVREKLNGEWYYGSHDVVLMSKMIPHKWPDPPLTDEEVAIGIKSGSLSPEAPKPPERLINRALLSLRNQHANGSAREDKWDVAQKIFNSHEAMTNYLVEWADRTDGYLLAARNWLHKAERANPKKVAQQYFMESMHMGDKYVTGQAGAVGPHSKAENNKFQQIWNQSSSEIDLPRLAEEFGELRLALKHESTKAEHYKALASVAEAEEAAQKNDGAGALRHLQAAGKWTLDVATKIGTSVAVKAITSAMGI